MKHLSTHPHSRHLLAAPLGLIAGIALATAFMLIAIHRLNTGDTLSAYLYLIIFLLSTPLILGAGILTSSFSYFATQHRHHTPPPSPGAPPPHSPSTPK